MLGEVYSKGSNSCDRGSLRELEMERQLISSKIPGYRGLGIAGQSLLEEMQ
jgi:hypothetical protein